APLDVVQHTLDCLHLGDGMIELGEACIGGMNVGVHQPRQDCLSAEIDDLSMRPLQHQDFSIGADLQDEAGLDRDGLADRDLSVNGYGLSPMEDEVGYC